MGTILPAQRASATSPVFPVRVPFILDSFARCKAEFLDGANSRSTAKNPGHDSAGCQHWYKLILSDLGAAYSEAVVMPCRTWSEPDLSPPIERRGGSRDVVSAENRARAGRRAKRAIRFAVKTAQLDRMVTLTHKDFKTREEMLRLYRQFKRLVREAVGLKVPMVVVPEIHDSEKTLESKRGSVHLHIAMCGRQDYKLLISIWHYRICGGRGAVHVRNPSRGSYGKGWSASKLAAYLSKYVSKAVTTVKINQKSYWISQGIVPPVRTVLLFRDRYGARDAALKHFNDRGFSGVDSWEDFGMDVLWLAAG